MTDGQAAMEVEAPVLTPQQAVSPPSTAALSKKTLAASDATSTAKRTAARRKTLCDITNLSTRDLFSPFDDATVPADGSACPAAPASAGGGGAVEEYAELVKERQKNEELVRLLTERDDIIEKLRLANWELARTNSQMMAEVNLARNRLKAVQHELACSKASLNVKTSELEVVKKTMPRRNAPVQRTQHPGPDRAAPAQAKDGDVLDAEPASDAMSIQRSGNASRKRVQRSRSLGPTTSAKLALPPKDKDRDASQRRKSMRTPQTSSRAGDLFEIEDVQLAISSCKIDPESASGSDKPPVHQFLRRSSLGRPLRQARERVTTYKEMPLHVKLRRPE